MFVADYAKSTTFFNGLGVYGPGTNTSSYNPGGVINTAVGYRLPLGFRAEVELGCSHFNIATIDLLSTNGVFPKLNGSRLSNPSGGSYDRFTAMTNLFYDLPVTFAGITPYLGGGVGCFHGTSTDAAFGTSGGSTFTIRGASGENAVIMGEIGMSYALMPRLSLVPAYRYEYFFGTSIHNANTVKIGLRHAI